MNLWFSEEMTLMYICIPKLLKEDFNQEMLGTSNIYKRYVCECYVWYFIHHGMIKCWLQSYICSEFLCEKGNKKIVIMCIGNALISMCFYMRGIYDYVHVILI